MRLRLELGWFAGAFALVVAGCGGGGGGDADGGGDDGGRDAAVDAGDDGGGDDGGTMDAGAGDAGADDAGSDDGGGDDGGGDSDGGADGGDPDGGAEDAATGDGGVCTACLESALDWGRVGGFVAWQARSEVTPCRDYEYTRMSFGGGGDTESCTNAVPCSSADQIDMGDLLDALAHEDVVAAFEAAPVLYGRDTRPVDGQVFEISQGGKTVQVGAPCSGASGCMEIPEGVAALRDLLDMLEDERLAEEDCASTFP